MSKEKCPYCHYNQRRDTDSIYSDVDGKIKVYPDGSIECSYDDDGMPSMMGGDAGTINYCPMCGRRLDEKEGVDWNDLLVKIGFTLSLLLVPISVTLAITVNPNFLCGVMLGIVLPFIILVWADMD